MGLNLSESKTQIVHLGTRFDFLGFRIHLEEQARQLEVLRLHLHPGKAAQTLEAQDQVRPASCPRPTTRRTADPAQPGPARMGRLLQHGVSKHTFSRLGAITWLRVANLDAPHRMSGAAFRRRFHTPRMEADSLDGVQLFDIATVAVSRYRWRGTKIPSPWAGATIDLPA